MGDEIVKVEDGAVKLALGRFALSLRQRAALLKEIAAAQLLSVRRTFREQGSPSGSWAPLAPSTLRNPGSKASAGRKILIVSGRLLNSIQSKPTSAGVVIGTNLVYARVQQLGSADRGAGEGPQARIAGRNVLVAVHSRDRLREVHYGTRQVVDSAGKTHHVPVAMRTGMRDIETAEGVKTTVRSKFQGPRQMVPEKVHAHTRFQNIPARPYLVIRPEDPARIRGQVVAFIRRSADAAGLKAGAR